MRSSYSEKQGGTRSTYSPDRLMFWLLLILFSGLSFSGLSAIPFHPDESTQLYMSSDFELLFQDPMAMTWQPGQEGDWRQRYRELDAPLTKYILGLGRTVAGIATLPVDWDWSASWKENQQNGGFPSPDLLLAARTAITLLLPLSLVLIFLIGKEMSGPAGGLAAMFILGTNALVLLHGRRTMAEGPLLFGVCLAVWGFLQGHRLPWLAGLGMALAFNAKQSTLALLPIGLLAVFWLTEPVSSNLKRIFTNLLFFGISFAVITLLLNPLLWRYPQQAMQASWAARTDLLSRQVGDARSLVPEQVMPGIGQRSAVLIANLFIQPVSFYEVGNYRMQTAPAERAYLANPFTRLFRGITWGSVFLALTFLGVTLGGMALVKPRKPGNHSGKTMINEDQTRRAITIVLLAGVFQLSGLLAAVPLPFQRYVMPLVPFVCLWSGYGLYQSYKIFAHGIYSRQQI